MEAEDVVYLVHIVIPCTANEVRDLRLEAWAYSAKCRPWANVITSLIFSWSHTVSSGKCMMCDAFVSAIFTFHCRL